MTPSIPDFCPACGSTDNLMIIQSETEYNLLGEIYWVTSPALQCKNCSSIWHGPGHDEALRQAIHDAYRDRHGLNKSNLTHREVNLLRAEISDLESVRDRLIPWLTANTPQAQRHKKEHQERLLAIFAREQMLSQEFDVLVNLRGEEFERLTQKIKQLEVEITTYTDKLGEIHALLESQKNDLKQAEIKAKKAESETKTANSELTALHRTFTKLERKIEKLKPGSEGFERQIERLNSRLKSEKEKRRSAESNLVEATSAIHELNSSISENQREFKNLETRYAREQELLESERSKAELLRLDMKEAMYNAKRPRVSEATLKRAKSHLVQIERQLEEAQNKIQILASQSNIESAFHLTDENVIHWLADCDHWQNWDVPEYATMIGDGPIYWDQMIGHLQDLGCQPYLSGCDWIIVGRENWTPENLDRLIEERGENEIKIVSQELFLAAVISGKDPFEADNEVLLLFAEGHPALEYLRDAGFEWPLGCTEGIGPPPPDPFGVAKSPLKVMNPPYTVGEDGLRKNTRRRILTEAFNGDLPWVESDEYMALWGNPGTRYRLRQMAYHISRQIPKHRGMGNHKAVQEWEEDLEWLYYQFYKPWMRFSWPGSDYN